MEKIVEYFKKVEVATTPIDKDLIDLTIEEFKFGEKEMEFRDTFEEVFAFMIK